MFVKYVELQLTWHFLIIHFYLILTIPFSFAAFPWWAVCQGSLHRIIVQLPTLCIYKYSIPLAGSALYLCNCNRSWDLSNVSNLHFITWNSLHSALNLACQLWCSQPGLSITDHKFLAKKKNIQCILTRPVILCNVTYCTIQLLSLSPYDLIKDCTAQPFSYLNADRIPFVQWLVL